MKTIPQLNMAQQAIFTLKTIFKGNLDAIAYLAQFGDMIGYSSEGMSAVLLQDPKMIDAALNQPQIFGKLADHKDLPLTGSGLFSSEGLLWKHQRSIIQSAFRHANFEKYISIIFDETSRFLNQWQLCSNRALPINVSNDMSVLTINVITRCLFQQILDESTINKLKKTWSTINASFIKPFYLPLWLPLPRHTHVRRALVELDEIAESLLKSWQKNEAFNENLAKILMNAPGLGAPKMSDSQLRDEIKTMLLAGHETSSNSLCWIFTLIGKYPGIQQKIFEEAVQVIGNSPVISHESLEKLEYTEWVIKESIRLYPTVWSIPRITKQDAVLGEYCIKKGTRIDVFPILTHYDPRFWRDPGQFIPERFKDFSPPRCVYYPFGHGQRKCIGEKLAMTEMKIILALTMMRYKISLMPNEKARPVALITLKPVNGLNVFISTRR